MAAPVTGPCAPWATEEQVTAGCDCADATAEQVAAKIAAASDLLYRFTGYQWPGECTTTIRPVTICGRGPVAIGVADSWWIPDGIDATLAVNQLCGCSDDQRTIHLPGGPVSAVSEVTIDGQVLDEGAYRVDDWELLIRQDGGVWPSTQQLHLPAGDAGTWTVEYTHGLAPPISGVDAAIALACELAKACIADGGSCALDPRAVRASRSGVEYELQPADLLTEGRTGIETVDLFLLAVNPNRLTQGSSVRSPDVPRHRVTS